MIFLLFLPFCFISQSLAGELSELTMYNNQLTLKLQHLINSAILNLLCCRILDHIDVVKLDNYLITATRVREDGEIIPVSVEQSATKDNNEASYGAGRAIDLDLGTRSRTEPGSDGTIWLKLTLDKVYCVQQVIRYRSDGTPLLTWTCTDTDCYNCVGDYCNDYTLTVSTKEDVSDLSPVSNCKYGDTVKLERVSGSDQFSAFEIAIVGQPGNLHIQTTNSN